MIPFPPSYFLEEGSMRNVDLSEYCWAEDGTQMKGLALKWGLQGKEFPAVPQGGEWGLIST